MIPPYFPTNPFLTLLTVVVVGILFFGCEDTRATETAEMFGRLYRSRANEVWSNFNDAREVVREVHRDHTVYVLREDEPDWKPHLNAREERETVASRLRHSLQYMGKQHQTFKGLAPPDHEEHQHEAGIAYMGASVEVGNRLLAVVNENIRFLREFKQDLPPTLEEFLAKRKAGVPKALSLIPLTRLSVIILA